tara:strand:+ start:1813 stop:2289 length:477 start_codon:yes stop_codon:yes gene_type:complete
MLDRKFFRKISADVVMKYRKHIFDPAGGGAKAKMVNDRNYPDYKTTKGKNESLYKKRKQSGKIKVNGKPQDLKFAKHNAPVLTGDLFKDYGFQKLLSNGFSFGFKDEGAKVKRLNDSGRLLSTDRNPIPKSVEKFIMHEAGKYVEKELGKNKGGTFNI